MWRITGMNMIYRIQYDGYFLRYRIANLFKPLIRLLGFSTHLEISLNMTIGCELRVKRNYSVLVLHFYRHGSKKSGKKLKIHKRKLMIMSRDRTIAHITKSIRDILWHNYSESNTGVSQVKGAARKKAIKG